MQRTRTPVLLLLAAVVSGILFNTDATGIALFGCILLSGAAGYALLMQSALYSGPGKKAVFVYAALMLAAVVAGVLPSKYPYLSLIVGATHAALAAGCALGLLLGPGAALLFRTLLIPAGLWVSAAVAAHLLGLTHKSSLFADSNSFATVVNLTFILALGLLAQGQPSRWQRWGAATVAVMSVIGMFYLQSKGAWLALLLTLALLAAVGGRAMGLNRKHWACLALLAGVAVASVSMRISDETKELRDGRSTSSRKAMLVATVKIIQAHPWGVGTGQWFRAYEAVRTHEDVESAGTHAHNDYLESMAEAGPLGLPALAFPGLLVLWIAVKLRREPDKERARHQAFLAALVGICAAQAMVNFTYQQTGFNLIVGLACGALLQGLGVQRVPQLSRQGRLAATSAFVLFAAVTAIAAFSFATLNAVSVPERTVAKVFPWLKDPRIILALSRMNPLDTRPRIAYATRFHQVAANTDLPVDVRQAAYRVAMQTYLALNKDIPDDFQLLGTAGSLARSSVELDPAARALAEALLRRAYELAPSQIAVAMPYAQVLFSNGQFDAAEQVVQDTAAKAPTVDQPALQQALRDIRANRPK